MRALKFILTFMIFLFSINIVYSDTTINSLKQIDVEIINTIDFEIDKEEEYLVNQFELKSFFYPQEYEDAQSLISYDTNFNEYQIKENVGNTKYLNFLYNTESLLENNQISNTFTVRSNLYRPEITEKITYPISPQTQREYEQYLQYTEFIDVDSAIVQKASELAQGEDDVYITASKVAKWIREDVEYDLSTLTENPNQASTQVFRSKEGVCREITNLYISMMRSLGIPARVVTGVSYTNSQELVDFLGSNWGGHAWAEVLIGDEWVPFDLTYNQYGFVDSTHIVFDKYYKIRSSSVLINGSGYGFDIVPNSLSSATEYDIKNQVENTADVGFDIDINYTDNLGFGSYGYVGVDIKNLQNYYQVLFLRMAKVESVELAEPSNMKMLIFEPNEEMTVYFRFKIPEDLDQGFIYTYPFTIYNEFVQENVQIEVRGTNPTISEEDLPLDEQRDKENSDNRLRFNCKPIISAQDEYINCNVKNTNNFIIDDLQVCFNSECSRHELNLNQEIDINYTTSQKMNFISYDYNKEFSQVSIEMPKPNLKLDYNQNSSYVSIIYDIEDHFDDLNVDIYVNDKFIDSYTSRKDFIKFNLPEGNNTINFNLKIRDEVLKSESIKLQVGSQRQASFISDIVTWLSGMLAL